MSPILTRYFQYASRKKSLADCKSLETKLDRCLSVYQLIFYGFSHMIGAGIYVLTGHIIKDRVGPATNLSFLLSGLVSIFTGLCYCEFATLIPKAGSCYTYTYLLLGELMAFLTGWTMVMDLIITLSSVAKGFSGALNLLYNDAIRNFTETYVPLTKNSEFLDTSVDLIALLLLFILFLITLTGANISMNINSILAILQISFLVTIIVSCFVYGSSENYFADGGYLPFGFFSIFQGAGIAVFAYSGFDCIGNSAEETKEPKKSIPIAMFTSLGIVIVLYILSSTGLSYMVPRLQIDVKAPFIAAFYNRNLNALKWVAGIATLMATGANKLTVVYVVPRMIYAMANDGLIFRFLGNVDDKSKTPVSALIVGILMATVLAIFIKIQILADITSMGIIISFVMVGVNLMVLRYLYEDVDDSELKRCQDIKMRISVCPKLKSSQVFIGMFISLLVSLFVLGFSANYLYDISVVASNGLTTASLILIGLFIIILFIYKPNSNKQAFETPLMPLAPILTVALNIYLLFSLSKDTWIRFFIWSLLGFIIYIFYGIRNSNLSEKEEEKQELVAFDNTDQQKIEHD